MVGIYMCLHIVKIVSHILKYVNGDVVLEYTEACVGSNVLITQANY